MKKHSNVEVLPTLSKEQDYLNRAKIEGEQDAKKALDLASTLRGKHIPIPNRRDIHITGAKNYAK